jgi:hypothetical protein
MDTYQGVLTAGEQGDKQAFHITEYKIDSMVQSGCKCVKDRTLTC